MTAPAQHRPEVRVIVPSYTAIKLPPGWKLLSNTATADGWRELVYGWEA